MVKRITILWVLITSYCVPVLALNPSCNYQGNDARAYIGQYLYVIPLFSQSGYSDVPQIITYKRFMNERFPTSGTEINMPDFYHFDPQFRSCACGTEHKWLTGKTFYVQDVRLMDDCKSTWIFDLVNVNDESDKCRYVYYGYYRTINNNIEYPFVSLFYLDWLKQNYLNQEIVIGTHLYQSAHERYSTYHRNFDKDAITRESITYTDDIARYTVTDVFVHDTLFQVCFRMSDGRHIIDCPVGLLYVPNSQEQYATRLFLLKHWNELCRKYSQEHMVAIMRGEIVVGMTLEECIWSRGSAMTKKQEGDVWHYKWPNGTKCFEVDIVGGKVVKVISDGGYFETNKATKALKKLIEFF